MFKRHSLLHCLLGPLEELAKPLWISDSGGSDLKAALLWIRNFSFLWIIEQVSSNWFITNAFDEYSASSTLLRYIIGQLFWCRHVANFSRSSIICHETASSLVRENHHPFANMTSLAILLDLPLIFFKYLISSDAILVLLKLFAETLEPTKLLGWLQKLFNFNN